MDCKELEERLGDFLRNQETELGLFLSREKSFAKLDEEKKIKVPAEEALKRRLKSPEYHTNNTHLDVVWAFREGVRWFAGQLRENTAVRINLIAKIEKEGTA